MATATTAGALRTQVYRNIQNTRLGHLYAAPSWPNSPTKTGSVNVFQYYERVFGEPVYNGIADNYDVRLSGYLIPPASGLYAFHLSADDNAAVYLGYSQDPANKRLRASEPDANGYREWQAGIKQASRGIPPANVSFPVYLEAGRYYWVEALMKEGTGDDHLGVTWRRPGDPAPVNGGPAIQGQYLAMPIP